MESRTLVSPNLKATGVWGYLFNLQQSDTLCDVQLGVSNQEGNLEFCTVHKVVLSASSGYFQSCLTPDNVLEIYTLDGASFKDVQLLVKYMYRQITYTQLTEDNALGELVTSLEVYNHDDSNAMIGSKNQILTNTTRTDHKNDDNFWNHLYTLQQSGTFCDVQLCVTDGNEEIVVCRAHKIILAALSRFFRRCLMDGNFLDVYNFDGVMIEQLNLMVSYIYRQVSWLYLEGDDMVKGLVTTLELFRRRDNDHYFEPQLEKDNMLAPKRTKYQKKDGPVVVSIETARELFHRMKKKQALTQRYRNSIAYDEDTQVITVLDPNVSSLYDRPLIGQTDPSASDVTQTMPSCSDVTQSILSASDVNQVSVVSDDNRQDDKVLLLQNCAEVKEEWGTVSKSSVSTHPHDLAIQSSKKIKIEVHTDEKTDATSRDDTKDHVLPPPDVNTVDRSDVTCTNKSDDELTLMTDETALNASTDAMISTGASTSGNTSNTEVNNGGVKKAAKTKNITLSNKCEICTFACFTELGLKRHVNKAHPKYSPDTSEKFGRQKWSCPKCCRTFMNAQKIGKHMWTKYNQAIFQCVLCDDDFNTFHDIEMLRKHLIFKHDQSQAENEEEANSDLVKCGMCLQKCENDNILDVHITSLHPEFLEDYTSEMTMCEKCGKSFENIRRLRAHMHVAHRDEKVLCELCLKPFKTYTSFKRHLTTVHLDDRKFQCDFCPSSFKTKEDCRRHMILHSSKNSRLCPENEKFPKHPPGADYPCSFCGKIFRNFHHRKAHENIQHHDKSSGVSYVCTSCDKSYETRHYLNMHINNVHKPKRFICGACNRRYQFNYEIVRHRPRCQGFPEAHKPFQCQVCGRKFTIKGNLTKHRHRGSCKASNLLDDPDITFMVVVEQEGEEQVEIPLSQLQELGIESEEILFATESIATECHSEDILQQVEHHTEEVEVLHQDAGEICYITEQHFEESEVVEEMAY